MKLEKKAPESVLDFICLFKSAPLKDKNKNIGLIDVGLIAVMFLPIPAVAPLGIWAVAATLPAFVMTISFSLTSILEVHFLYYSFVT